MFDFLVFFSVYVVVGETAILLFCKVVKYGNKEIQFITLGLLLRIVLTYGYYAYSLTHLADASLYFQYSQGAIIDWKRFFTTTGSDFIYNLSALFQPLVSPFENRYLMMYVPYSFLGFCASMIFYRTLEMLFGSRMKKAELFFLSFFLPNMVFWTSNLGKDSIIYFGLMFILYGVVSGPNKAKGMASIILGGAVAYFVRPHVLLFLFAGFGLGIVLERQALSFRTVVLVAIIAVGFLALHQKIFQVAGLESEVQTEDGSTHGVGDIYHSGVRQMEASSSRMGSGEGASIGAKKFNILLSPLYLVEFLGSPFIWQARKPMQLGSAVENILYQFFLVYFLFHWKAFAKSKLIPYKYSLLMYSIFNGVVMGVACTNFGLSVRQKCMVLPCIILFYACVRAQLFMDRKKRVQRKARMRTTAALAPLGLQPQPKSLP
jgi:hypothetical protein